MPIHHTNVMMAIGTGWAAMCLDCVTTPTTARCSSNRSRGTG